MKTTLAVLVGIMAGSAGSAVAQDRPPEIIVSYIRFHRVHLRNGNVIDGDLIGLTDREAVLKLSVGHIAIRRTQIEKIEFVKMRSITEKAPVVIPKPTAPRLTSG